MRVSTVKVEIGYDGEGVRGGTMDVRELAPALLALGALIQESHMLLNEGRGRLTTHVKSDFKTGSFEITLKLVQDLATQAAFILENAKHLSAADVAKLIGLTGGSTISLIHFIKWLRGRKIRNATIIQSGNMKIETEGDFDSIEVTPEVIKLSQNRNVRLNLRAVFAPLKNMGVELFYAKENGNKFEEVKRDDVPSFDPPETRDIELTTSSRTVAVNLIEISFEEGLKWKLSDGENRFNALVLDKSFQGEIEAGKKFSKGDILTIELRTRQVNRDGAIKNEHEVIKVLNHVPADQQTILPLFSAAPKPQNETHEVPDE